MHKFKYQNLYFMQETTNKFTSPKHTTNRQVKKHTSPPPYALKKKNPTVLIQKSPPKPSLKTSKQSKTSKQQKKSKQSQISPQSSIKNSTKQQNSQIQSNNKRSVIQKQHPPFINTHISQAPIISTNNQQAEHNINPQNSPQNIIQFQVELKNLLPAGSKQKQLKYIKQQNIMNKPDIKLDVKQAVNLEQKNKDIAYNNSELAKKVGNEMQAQQMLLNELQQNCYASYLAKSSTFQQKQAKQIGSFNQFNTIQDIIQDIRQVKDCECLRHQSSSDSNTIYNFAITNINITKSGSLNLGSANKKRKLELICLDCKDVVCDYCVIFGEKDKQAHKLHQVVSVDEFIKDVQKLQQFSNPTLQSSNINESTNNQKQLTPQLLQHLSTKKQQIHKKCSSIIEKLKQQEQKVYKQLQQFYHKIDKQVKQQQNKQLRKKQNIRDCFKSILDNCKDVMKFSQAIQVKQSFIYRQRLQQAQIHRVNRVKRLVKKIYEPYMNDSNKTIQQMFTELATDSRLKIIQKNISEADKITVQFSNSIEQYISKFATVKIKQPKLSQLQMLKVEEQKQQKKLQYIKKFKELLDSQQQFHPTPVKNDMQQICQKPQKQDTQRLLTEEDNEFIFDVRKYQADLPNNQTKIVVPKMQKPDMRKGQPKQQAKQLQKQGKYTLTKSKSLQNLYQFSDKTNKNKFKSPQKNINTPETTKKKLPFNPNILAPSKLQLSFVSIQSSILMQQNQYQHPNSATSLNNLIAPLVSPQVLKIMQQYAESEANPKNRNKITVLNFQNQSISDQSLEPIFSTLFSKINKKSLKYLKLSDNKITDAGFNSIIKYMGSASNVNMSGNLLTDNVLDLVIKCRDRLAPLRILNLKGNKIGSTKGAKDKIGVLGKMGIMVQL